ncbi:MULTISPECIES: rhodanese-related sulfurtransferase [unclassified Prochlorococcus]|uniref:oxygen-dependent tRNA uridine(34) hydroxylase TrhO n=1 Tax=unclassified Prochlorococcus TaxID=2627481 RepID=UPI000533A0D7|nr:MULTISPECIES: rhodanese-related sulfurtransferase [unclassified Prochlorococcus]KGG15426.1 Rhodanese domain protein UPF0176 [Prochlorococcus sp. MIT 0602]KGG17704.1 Rhodanese domain protein UPF0176 [Prochlorococcus sp. MIT 0603]
MIIKTKEKDVGNRLMVAAFYSFSPIEDETIPTILRELVDIADKYNVRGTILVALEGINGTICGPSHGIQIMRRKLNSLVLDDSMEVKISFTSKQAFRRFKARKKREIITMGIDGVNPRKTVGKYVEPDQWNEFIDDPLTLVIDMRNEYEVSIGSFQGSLNPHTDTFREFPEWARRNLDKLLQEKKHNRIAMFCTGGIRCEKATSFLKQQGVPEVYHLRGGILRYLAEVPEDQSRWDGECFVFDHRVALNHKLTPGEHRLCFACGMPLSPEDRQKSNYLPGIQCHHCENVFSDDDRDRFKERQKHIKQLQERLPGNSIWPSA